METLNAIIIGIIIEILAHYVIKYIEMRKKQKDDEFNEKVDDRIKKYLNKNPKAKK